MKRNIFLKSLILPIVISLSCCNNSSSSSSSDKKDNYIILDTLPSTHSLPSNYNFVNNYYPNKIYYYGNIHDYDVFSWEDDNAFGFVMHGFAIDNYEFESQNFIILLCFPHTGEPVDFYDIDGEIVTLSDHAIPFTYLYANSVFTLEEVRQIYLERAVNLNQYTFEDNKYIFSITPNSNYGHINQGDIPFEINHVEYQQSADDELFEKIKEMVHVDKREDVIYFGKYDDFEVIMPKSGFCNNGLPQTYHQDSDYLSEVRAYNNNVVFSIQWLYRQGLICDDHLEKISLQTYSYALDCFKTNHPGDEESTKKYQKDFIEEWTYNYRGYNDDSMKWYLQKLNNNIAN